MCNFNIRGEKCVIQASLRVCLVRELGGEGRGGILTEGSGGEIF